MRNIKQIPTLRNYAHCNEKRIRRLCVNIFIDRLIILSMLIALCVVCINNTVHNAPYIDNAIMDEIVELT